MQARPYQIAAKEQIRKLFSEGKKRVILCLPTGAGKSFTFSDIAKSVSVKKGKSLILTDRLELLTQASGTLSRVGLQHGRIVSGEIVDIAASCHVAMVETYIRRANTMPELLAQYNLVIMDECHKGNFRKVLENLSPSSYVIGATATPVAAKKTFPLRDYFDDIVCPVSIPELIQAGFLVPAITYSARLDHSVLKKSAGEYSEKSQMEVFDRRERYEGVVEKWKQFASGRRTMCFCVNVEHSKATAEEFCRAGVGAMHVDGTTLLEEREAIFAAHQRGDFPLLCNVGITTAGYDDPLISCIIFNRVTTSITTWLQACGRGSRPAPGKENFIILDMGENYREHGLWEADTDWRHIFKYPKMANEGIAPMKLCPQCEAIILSRESICPYCHFEIPKREKEEIDLNVEFARVDPKQIALTEKPKPPREMWPMLSIEEVAEYVRGKTYKIGWAVRLLKERGNPEGDLHEFAREMGYKPGWVDYQLAN